MTNPNKNSVTAVSITRLIFLVSLDVTEPNVTWVFIDPQIWTCVELNIAVVCGCLPQLRPLLLLITTGSPSGTVASSARGTTDTIGSYRKGPWAKKFGSTVGSAMMSGKGGDTVISVSDIPLVEREEGGRYVRLDHDVEVRVLLGYFVAMPIFPFRYCLHAMAISIYIYF